jgi:hypothetical protein
MTDEKRPPEPTATHCEWCGADFAPEDARATVAMETAARHARHPPPVPVAGGDVPTHCEWCGAEYPVPGDN